jgi:chromosomal replication initiation ATPase DnaA
LKALEPILSLAVTSPPDLETRVAIIQKKAALEHLPAELLRAPKIRRILVP